MSSSVPSCVSKLPESSGTSAYLADYLRNIGVPHNTAMPRKIWVGKNSYCKGSHLTDEAFKWVLLLFLAGVPASNARKALAKCQPPIACSEKTILRHYERIGDAIFERHCEKPLLAMHPGFERVKKEMPDVYDEWLKEFLDRLHTDVLMTDESWPHGRNLAQIEQQYRNLSKRKNGIRTSVKEHFALSMYLSMVQDAWRTVEGVEPPTDTRLVAKATEILLLDFMKKKC